MSVTGKYVVGTSGYSFADWTGTFYAPQTKRSEMFAEYIKHFQTVELNFTYYRLPTLRTLEALTRKSPPGFCFWVKANQETTHKQNRQVAEAFLEALGPMQQAGKLAGVLLQFPQSFHRTPANRKYLAATIEDFVSVPRAVEFRHYSWRHEATLDGLHATGTTLVVPDVPELEGLFRIDPTATAPLGYLRLHSRKADNWYAGGAKRYDYSYTDSDLQQLQQQWAPVAELAEKLFVFFNNCHRGQAARNAEAFRRIIGQIR